MKSGITATLCQSKQPTSDQNQRHFAKPAEDRSLLGSVSVAIDKNPRVWARGAEIRRKRYCP